MNIKKKLENWKRKIVYYDPFLFIILLLILGGLFFLRPTITGYAVGVKQNSYSDSLDLVINESSSYDWFLGHPGELKSVRLDGMLSKEGSAKVYLVLKILIIVN